MARKWYLDGAFTILLVVTVVASLGLPAITGGVAANHDSPGNYTVHLPEASDHYPGDTNQGSASIWHLSSMTDGFEGTSSKKGFEVTDTLVIESEEIDFSQCTTENTRAFGIDRGNDDSGSNTDDSLLSHRKDSQFKSWGIVVEFYGEGALAGEPVSINAEDQIVAVQQDCYTMPSEPGWYQIYGSLNGTGYNGNHFGIDLTSHYFYICECDSEKEAREKLGPPPSEQSGSESTPTATAESTATPESNSEPTVTATAEPTAAQGESTPTATPESSGDNSTATSESSNDAGPSAGGQKDSESSNDVGPSAGGQKDSESSNDGQAAGGQQHDGSQPQQGESVVNTSDGVPMTPTIAQGPGFGAGLALVALAGAALLALRRN